MVDHHWQKPATFFIGRSYAAYTRAAAANAAAWGRLWRRRARHIGESVGPRVVEPESALTISTVSHSIY